MPWVLEAFHAVKSFKVTRAKTFLAASPLVSWASGRTPVGLRPTKLLVGREKKLLVPRIMQLKKKNRKYL